MREQLHAQLILQPGNRHAQRRLADRTAFGGTTEITFLGQRHDVAQLGQCHLLLS